MRERVLAVLGNFANAVCDGLPEHAEIPVEKEVDCGHKLSQNALMSETLKVDESSIKTACNQCAEVAELADAPA